MRLKRLDAAGTGADHDFGKSRHSWTHEQTKEKQPTRSKLDVPVVFGVDLPLAGFGTIGMLGMLGTIGKLAVRSAENPKSDPYPSQPGRIRGP